MSRFFFKPWSRLYSSSFGSRSNFKFAEIKPKLLEKALSHVFELGWSKESLARAADNLELPPTAQGIVSRGEVEIVEYFLKNKSKHIFTVMESESINEGNYEDASIASSSAENRPIGWYNIHTQACTMKKQHMSKLSRILILHANYLHHYVTIWPSAVALLIDPRNIGTSLTLFVSIVEELHELTGLSDIPHDARRLDAMSERLLLGLTFIAVDLYVLGRQGQGQDSDKNAQQRPDIVKNIEGSNGLDNQTNSAVSVEVIDFIERLVEFYDNVRESLPMHCRE
jgi:hypothetical protein